MLEALSQFIQTRSRLVIISGAGLSTESGIPDYRSPGRPTYTPMQHQAFVQNRNSRARYWSRSMIGYAVMSSVSPNPGHIACAELEAMGRVRLHITQNVDGLLRASGCRRLVELHGSIHGVQCLDCGYEVARADVQQGLLRDNQSWWNAYVADAALSRPDGDFDSAVQDYSSFQIPTCSMCGGDLKPSVVFFGDNVPAAAVTRATHATEHADGVLVVGTSLSVFSAYRFVRMAKLRNIPIAILSAGPCRADADASLKVEALCADALATVVSQVRPVV
jgi:NAD-dependent SIR2 family protein deacetylase